jgi:hypothetical protein
MSKKLTVVLYDLEVTTDIVHGWKKYITEYCVKELSLFINPEMCFISSTESDTKFRLSQAENIREVSISAATNRLLHDFVATTKKKEDLEVAIRIGLRNV